MAGLSVGAGDFPLGVGCAGGDAGASMDTGLDSGEGLPVRLSSGRLGAALAEEMESLLVSRTDEVDELADWLLPETSLCEWEERGLGLWSK